MTGDGIEHTVDISAAARRTVQFGEVDILVDGNCHRDVRECEHLGNGNLHDDDIHIGQTGEIPVTARLAHIVLIVVSIENRSPEELDGKITVFLVTVFRQQFLVFLVGRIETFDGLDNESVNHLLVVIPIETLLFQNGIQIRILLDQRTINLAPHFTIRFVGIFFAAHILLVNGALLDLIAEFTYRLHIIFPATLLGLHEEVELFILFQLYGEPVVGEA